MIQKLHSKRWLSTVILAALLAILSVFSLFVGATEINIRSLFSGGMELKIFLLARIPRLLAILCTGIGMSVAGLIMQQLCMNKFVSPTTGATIQSAQFGIALAMVFFPTMGLWVRTLFAFVLAVAGTLAFVFFIQRIQVKDTVLVPLVGIMFGNIIGGVTNFISWQWEINQQLNAYFSGSFALIIQGNYELVYLVVPLVLLAFLYANHFNIIGMGQDFSRNLGVNYNLILILGLSIASVITASVIVIVGQISYIGLIVPNLVALFKGDKIRGTLLDTALFGALFVLICDILARSILIPYEIPIELIVGIVGSVIFIAMLMYKLKHGKKAIRPGRHGRHHRHGHHPRHGHHRHHGRHKEAAGDA
ncbi:MAG: iron chelate uptake ABC transporter family permease subunit [Oscillospiraceae bacterium]|nr:iron chelate uptake ABC transporter family permease subunit [Oscillospiraceae bacterium]